MVFIGLMTGCFDNVNYNVIILNEDKVRDFTSFGRYFPQVFNPNRSFRLNPSLASRSKNPDMAATIKTQGQPTCYVRVALVYEPRNGFLLLCVLLGNLLDGAFVVYQDMSMPKHPQIGRIVLVESEDIDRARLYSRGIFAQQDVAGLFIILE